MEKIVIVSLVILSIISTLSICITRADNMVMNFAFDSEDKYIRFDKISSTYSKEDAEKDGCYVLSESEVITDSLKWKNFMSDCLAEKNTSIRIAYYIESSIFNFNYFDKTGCDIHVF